MTSPSRLASALALSVGFAVALGAVAIGCGPKEKFCPDTSDGVCIPPMDAQPKSDAVDAPAMEMGSIYVGADSGADASAD